MLIGFQLIDGRQKRWFSKVAKGAADRVSSLSQDFEFKLQGSWGAEFDLGQAVQPTICHTHGEQTISVIFAAANWRTVASSIDDATEQLASAILRVIPRERVLELRQLFIDGGVSRFRSVQLSSRSVPHDPRTHLVLYLTAPGFEFADLERVYDGLDSVLRGEGSGEVNGSGAGIAGYHLDVSLERPGVGIRSLFDFLRRSGLADYARVINSVTGQQVSEEDVAQP
jgi:hypothetical protein